MTRALLAALALLLAPSMVVAGTGPGGLGDFSAFAAGTPQQGLRTGTVTIHPKGGGTHRYRTEYAETPAQQATGMMFRRTMDPKSAMIFPMRPPRVATFYMRNTYVPLDIVFIGPDHRVLNVGEGRPLDEAIVASVAPAAAVLELKGGEAARIGLGPGDRVDW